jgi:hypothetical protein
VAPPASQPAKPGQGDVKAAFLEQIRLKKRLLHGTVVAQAARIDVTDTQVVFAFGPQHRVLRKQVEENRGVLEQLAEEVAGRKLTVTTVDVEAAPTAAGAAPAARDAETAAKLRERALADNAVQAMLDVFPAAEIKDVEEIDK